MNKSKYIPLAKALMDALAAGMTTDYEYQNTMEHLMVNGVLNEKNLAGELARRDTISKRIETAELYIR